MKEYEVVIKETLSMTVTVEAQNPKHAKELVEKNWKDGEYVLDSEHFKNATFTIPPKDRDNER